MDLTPNQVEPTTAPLTEKPMNVVLNDALPETPIAAPTIDMESVLDNPNYKPTTLGKEDITAITAIRDNLISTLNNSLKNLNSLKDAISSYDECLSASLNSNLEYADIINKYTEPDRNSSTYGLPGVIASTLASYDLDALRKDNSRLATVKSDKEDADRRRDYYFKAIVSSFSALRSELNTFGDYNQRLFAFLEELNTRK